MQAVPDGDRAPCRTGAPGCAGDHVTARGSGPRDECLDRRALVHEEGHGRLRPDHDVGLVEPRLVREHDVVREPRLARAVLPLPGLIDIGLNQAEVHLGRRQIGRQREARLPADPDRRQQPERDGGQQPAPAAGAFVRAGCRQHRRCRRSEHGHEAQPIDPDHRHGLDHAHGWHPDRTHQVHGEAG